MTPGINIFGHSVLFFIIISFLKMFKSAVSIHEIDYLIKYPPLGWYCIHYMIPVLWHSEEAKLFKRSMLPGFKGWTAKWKDLFGGSEPILIDTVTADTYVILLCQKTHRVYNSKNEPKCSLLALR